MSTTDAADDRNDLAKLGLEVMHRIASVTPVTPASVVSIALLIADGKARSSAELAADCRALTDLIDKLQLPVTEPLALADETEVRRVLNLLAEHGNVSSHEGPEHLFYLNPEQSLRASYYRNMISHHFLRRAVLEMALAEQKRRLDEEAFWDRISELRDLLKFEFFFPDKERFHDEVAADLDDLDQDWQHATGPSLLKRMTPKVASWVIRPFLQAYLIVADELASVSGPVVDEKAFIAACLRRGEAYRLRGLVGADGVSTVLFRQALGLATNRGLLAADAADRHGFADEVRRALKAA
jgi:glycerol-3-phosphate O-acyltransferase